MAEWLQFRRAALILLVLCGTLCHQAAASSDDHRHDNGRVPTHCCAVCHTGHMPALQPAAALLFGPRLLAGGHGRVRECADVREPLIIFRAPRGPPV